MPTIPVFGLSRLRAQDPYSSAGAATAINHACREVGFFAAAGHGLSPGLIAAARPAARVFFAQLGSVKQAIEGLPSRLSRG